jgi:3-hydroxybutyryl-CoA dehydratase
MQTIENVPFDEIQIGQTADYQKTVQNEDVLMFAKLSGDVNPVHLDEEYAKTTQFGGRIAHGMYTAALMSAAMAIKLPGPGSVYLSQTMKFRAPVRIGDTLTVHLEITNKRERNKSVTVAVKVTNQDGARVVTGEASAIIPTEKIVIEAPELPSITIGMQHTLSP